MKEQKNKYKLFFNESGVFEIGILKQFFKYYSGSKSDDGVQNFSFMHFGWLSITIIIMFAMVYIYSKINDKNKKKVINVFAITLVIQYFVKVIWATMLGRFKADSMLPFHLCGIMVFVEFFAVFSNYQLLKEFAYSAGLPGAFIALLAPELNGYPLLSFQYQIYIIAHAILMIIPLFLVFGNGFKPNKKYLLKVYSLLCIIAAFDAIINKFLNSNYMFISKAPLNTPFVFVEKCFGYKGYVGFLLIGAFAALNLMYIPWILNSKKHGSEGAFAHTNN